MTNFITTVTEAPSLNTTLSLDASIYLGQNQIRRNVAHTVTTFLGSFVNDQFMEVPVGATVTQTFGNPTSAMILQVSSPVAIQVAVPAGTITLTVNKMMVLDMAVSSLSITNNGTVAVQAHLDYATT